LSYDSKEGKDDSQFGDNLADKDVMDEFESVKLSENEMAIENMLGGGEEMSEGPESLYGDQVTEGEDVNVAQLKNTKEFQDLVNYFKQNPDEAEEVKDDLGSVNEDYWNKTSYKNAYTKSSGVYSTYVYKENGKFYKEQNLPGGKVKKDEISEKEFKEIRKEYIKNKLIKVGMGAAGLGFVGALMAGPLGTMNPGEILQAVLIAAGIGAGATAALTEKESRKGFSIETALEKMDSIIGEDTGDKVTEILNSLTESEKEALLSTLKKKV
jgi:hypothetical protein